MPHTNIETTSFRDSVRRYYDANTAAFEKYGQGNETFHRAVWGPGVRTRKEAFRYLDCRIAENAPETAPNQTLRALDLGCGVGGSLLSQCRANPALEGLGVTLSPVQVERARKLAHAGGFASRLSFLEADFTELPESAGSFDMAFAIESFVHCPDTNAFFSSVSKHVRAGGRLIVCDDFLARAPANAREQRWLSDFQAGWIAPGLGTTASTAEIAASLGFRLLSDNDLTPHLELRRPRDRLLAGLVFLGRPLDIQAPRWRCWLGGEGLQQCLSSGVLEFRFLVFERS